jgi:GR25 family glycosyltransferase involved in LPS biosynthesis
MLTWLIVATAIILLILVINKESKQAETIQTVKEPATENDVLAPGFLGSPIHWKVYVINRDVDIERMKNFDESWKSSDFARYGLESYERFSAITPPENLSEIKVLLSEAAYTELEKTERRGVRLYDDSLTRNAVGCYLSHYTIWKKAKAKGFKHVLIFEDDCIIHPEFCSIMMSQRVPRDWAILKGGYYCIDCRDTQFNYIELIKEWCLHAYFVNLDNLDLYIDKMMPIRQQVDWQLHSVGAPHYGTSPIIAHQENEKFETTVQTQ